VQRSTKKRAENKDKLITDLRNREEDRQFRENEILKELKATNKNFTIVEKHVRKMVRKILMLTTD